jgi:chromatin structure-remodeling complex protein RSC7
MSSSRFNTQLATLRHNNLDGVYDTHTNMMYFPKIMQPSHARWEQMPPPSSSAETEKKLLTNGLTNGDTLPNGTSHDMDIDRPSNEPTSPTIFTPVPHVVSRNYTVVDTAYVAPPITTLGFPGPDGAIFDPTSGPSGLSAIPDDLVDELPEDCKLAFEAAKKQEADWKRQWGSEAQSGLRGALKVGLSGYPV